MPSSAIDKIIDEHIHHHGHISVADYMNIALADPQHGYYTTRYPIGQSGDFTTAPEISQLFGEMLAIYIIDHWFKIGQPKALHIVEFGPGRGTLMHDVLRTISGVLPPLIDALTITLIETSPSLTAKQREKLSAYNNVDWATSIDEINTDGDVFYLGNEFFDALPIHQYEKINDTWHERVIVKKDDGYAFSHIACDPQNIPDRFATNNFYEANPIAENIITKIAQNKNAHGVFIDYGYDQYDGLKDTFQALRKHDIVSVFETVGECDLTAHVNFARLREILHENDIRSLCMTQSEFLQQMGIKERATKLVEQNPDYQTTIYTALHRLLSPDEMGTLFKVLVF